MGRIARPFRLVLAVAIPVGSFCLERHDWLTLTGFNYLLITNSCGVATLFAGLRPVNLSKHASVKRFGSSRQSDPEYRNVLDHLLEFFAAV